MTQHYFTINYFFKNNINSYLPKIQFKEFKISNDITLRNINNQLFLVANQEGKINQDIKNRISFYINCCSLLSYSTITYNYAGTSIKENHYPLVFLEHPEEDQIKLFSILFKNYLKKTQILYQEYCDSYIQNKFLKISLLFYKQAQIVESTLRFILS